MPADSHEPYPLPQEHVAAAVARWMAGEQLTDAERQVVDYAMARNRTELFARQLMRVDETGAPVPVFTVPDRKSEICRRYRAADRQAGSEPSLEQNLRKQIELLEREVEQYSRELDEEREQTVGLRQALMRSASLLARTAALINPLALSSEQKAERDAIRAELGQLREGLVL